MWSFLFLWSCMYIAIVVAQTAIIIGHRGQRLDIRCPYKSGYEPNSKYFCKGECNFRNKNIMVKSGSPAKDRRFSLNDNKTFSVFTVTIADLRTEDAGQYWCAVKRTLTTDVYSEILLLVKKDKWMTEVPSISLFLITSTRVSSAPLTHQPLLPQTSLPDSSSFVIIIIISTGGLVLLLICAVLLTVAVRKKKMCDLVSLSAEVLQEMGRSGEENAYETGNPADVLNSHRVQSDDGSANEFHRPANAAAVDTDLNYINAAAALWTGANPDQIYTELNASRHSNIYQRLS